MESSKISEEFSDWEEIQFPSHNQSASSSFPPTEHLDINIGRNEQEDLPLQPEADGESLEVAELPLLSPLLSQGSETDLPPRQQIKSEHLDLHVGRNEQEKLPIQPAADGEPLENAESPLLSPLPSQGSETELPPQQQRKSDSKLSVAMSEVKIVICTTWKRMMKALGSSFQCPTFAPAAALVAVILACIKIVQGQNRLLLLIKKKEQRISELLHQIAHMNGILSARRRVPVLRIN